MRFTLALLAILMLSGCSDAPVAEKKEHETPPVPGAGRQAFQSTYVMARSWAPDAEPLHIRSINLPSPKSEDGKAGAWEIVYVSVSRSKAKPITWAAVESPGNLHKG